MEARLSSGTLVQGLLRLAQRDGGFGAVLARGDSDSGAVAIVLVERGERRMILERILGEDGRYRWQKTGNQAAETDEEFEKFLKRKRGFDPDLWVLELDVPSAERFADEMKAIG
ncbi:DUF1491 family protein [Allosphingosinicella sp.]|jgi:hypothetical protein|uniref:DUF1491 family protein n=1 Tax=Allosphingosinicella sp. TaxID=2823234 RepID=UPI002EF987BD